MVCLSCTGRVRGTASKKLKQTAKKSAPNMPGRAGGGCKVGQDSIRVKIKKVTRNQ